MRLVATQASRKGTGNRSEAVTKLLALPSPNLRPDHFREDDLSGRIRTCGQNKLNAHRFGEERVDVGFEDQ